MSKACTKCTLVKELTLFSLDKLAKSGRHTVCKACIAEKQVLRMQDPEYRRKKNAQMAQTAAKRKQSCAIFRADISAASRASKIAERTHPNQARPGWVDREFADLVFSEAYRLAERRKEITGFAWHVDHIIPLKNKLVSGLHVPTNIQVIPAITNKQKFNSFVVA